MKHIEYRAEVDFWTELFHHLTIEDIQWSIQRKDGAERDIYLEKRLEMLRCYRDKIKVEILMSNIRYKKALLDVVTSRERKILLKKEIEELRASLKKTGENHNESF